MANTFQFDRRALEALAAIYSHNGFEAAAQVLGISQSAVSQRFKMLQEACGDPLLIRGQPYELTSRGQALVMYLNELKGLEGTLIERFGLSDDVPTLRIGLSRDMLDTWFLGLLTTIRLLEKAVVTLVTVDQEETQGLLKRGEVNLCFSPLSVAGPKTNVTYIGNMPYILVAAPDFAHQYFAKNKAVKDALLQAPCLIYDRKDDLYYKYLKKYWHLEKIPAVVNTMPSVMGFKQIVLTGQTLALIPEIDVREEIKNGTLINLFPTQQLDMTIYLHASDYLRPMERALVAQVIKVAKNILK